MKNWLSRLIGKKEDEKIEPSAFDEQRCHFDVENRLKGILEDKGYGEFMGGTLYVSFNPEKFQQEYVFVNGHKNILTVGIKGKEFKIPSTESINLLNRTIYLKHKTEEHSFYGYWESYKADPVRVKEEAKVRRDWLDSVEAV